jgi:hypothetical protein
MGDGRKFAFAHLYSLRVLFVNRQSTSSIVNRPRQSSIDLVNRQSFGPWSLAMRNVFLPSGRAGLVAGSRLRRFV